MVVEFDSPICTGAAAEKLADLRSLLEQEGHAPNASGTNGGSRNKSQAASPSLIEFSEALFHRAPEDYLKRTGIRAMLQATQSVSNFYQDYIQSAEPYRASIDLLPESDERRGATVITTAIDDRPFVIDTLTELIRTHSLESYVYLHPILNANGNRSISLVYLEVEPIQEQALRDTLLDEINSALRDLTHVTDDFSEMLEQVEAAARKIESHKEIDSAERMEHAAFLRWLTDGGFVFLGFRAWHAADSKSDALVELPGQNLGLCTTREGESDRLQDIRRDAAYLHDNGDILRFSKVLTISPIHRAARMDLVSVRIPKPTGEVELMCFLGLLTSKSISQEASSVPLIRRKISRLLELENVLPNSHDYKEITSIVDGAPKSDLLLFPIEQLREEVNLVFSIQRRTETRIRYTLDPLRRFVNCTVVLPKDRYSGSVRQNIQDLVELALGADPQTSEYQLSVTDSPLVVIRLLVPNPTLSEITLDRERLEESISELTLTWDDKLLRALLDAFGDVLAPKLFAFYRKAFPEHYKAAVSPEEAVFDIERLEPLNVDFPLEIALERTSRHGEEHSYRLRLYKRGESLTLSAILPYLENAGFDIVSETVTPVATQGSVWAAIYDLNVIPSSGEKIDIARAQRVLLPGLRLVLQGYAENDALNQLMLAPGLSCQEVAVLRTLVQYLWQIKAVTSRASLTETLVANPKLARLLVDYFAAKFDPESFSGATPERDSSLEEISETFAKALKEVSQLSHDRALRALLNVIDSTVRTNFYQPGEAFRIAMKIECASIDSMPSPRPKFEIFVSSPHFEGVHLRGGKVARGGLRWSDRTEDYRTEVLGLMKTQMVKNSIIVPVGAKGGFVVKNLAKDQAEIRAQVEACYKEFIRSLLQITDNRTEDGIAPPPHCVRYDDEDPYLVVAADRGTATFSDIANAIAEQEFDFWLGDAFASGGSAGYDHKKYGITARGAWQGVCRHFREIGIDIDNQEFTVVGMGDMSGDVFGNGLLLSDNTKLIAAFNHRHIFLDPTPDPKISFAERQRLFNLPRSAWSDYKTELLSQGGGVFDRSSKEIPLSEEIRHALGTNTEMLSGEELIKTILRAPVDLLWNGGIGTYVKAYTESHLDVGDRANDDVRIDARELRARVIGEGGNLGFTQLARIEYSRIGGHCNIDAVDNSGGVDLSDLEVNMKILLREALRTGEISLEARNAALMSCVDEACDKVVTRNRTQSKALSLAVRRSRKNIGYYRGLLDSLEHEGLLDRAKEFLPSDDILEKRSSMKAGLTRPELAILVAYAKMSIYNTIMASSLPEEPFLKQYLFAYFPRSIVERFPEQVEAHPLRREIIATQVANALVERMGGSFVYRSAEETGLPKTEIIKAFLSADAILSAGEITEQLRVMDRANTTRFHLITLLRIQSAIDSMTRWFLEHRNPNLTLTELVEKYGDPFRRLMGETDSLITDQERSHFQESCRQLIVHTVPKELATTVASVSYATAYLDIVDISAASAADVLNVAHLYSELALALQVRNLLEQASELEPSDRWEALALRTIGADLRRSIAELTRCIIETKGDATTDAMETFLGERKETVERYRNSVKAFNNRSVTIPALLVISNQLFALSRTA